MFAATFAAHSLVGATAAAALHRPSPIGRISATRPTFKEPPDVNPLFGPVFPANDSRMSTCTIVRRS